MDKKLGKKIELNEEQTNLAAEALLNSWLRDDDSLKNIVKDDTNKK